MTFQYFDSRRQFPPTPFGQPASPSIPAWQRVAVVNKSKGTDDVGEEKREPAGEASSSNLHKSGKSVKALCCKNHC